MATEKKIQDPIRSSAFYDLLIFLGFTFLILLLVGEIRDEDLNPLPKVFDAPFKMFLGLALVFFLNRKREITWQDFGLSRPTNLLKLLGFSVLIIGVQLLVIYLFRAFVGSVVGLGHYDISEFDFMYQSVPLSILVVIIHVAAFGIIAEILYRGFMIHRLTPCFGGGKTGLVWAALLNSIFFGSIGFDWKFTAAYGAVMGLMFVLTKKDLWPLTIAHSILQMVFVGQFYFTEGSHVNLFFLF